MADASVEHIPDEDQVSRLLFEPSMKASRDADLRWENVFMFKTEFGCRESVVWRKYASTIGDVHEFGCQKQKKDRADGKTATYFGAITATVSDIRSLRSKNGVAFDVVHVPAEGIQHAEIHLPADRGSKNDRAELKVTLRDRFSSPPDAHSCPPEQAAA